MNQEQIEELELLGFANHQITVAMNFFSMEHSLTDMIEVCRKITVRKSKCGIFSQKGLRHLETVIKHIESLDVKVIYILHGYYIKSFNKNLYLVFSHYYTWINK